MFSELYLNKNDPMARNRSCMAIGNFFFIAWFTATQQVFFVGFLNANGASDIMIGTVNTIIIACGMLTLVSPFILERMKKRKRYMLTMRLIFGFLHLGVVGVLPFTPFSADVRLTLIIITLVVAAVISHAMIGSGIPVWHMQSVPERFRAAHFAYTSMGNHVIIILSMLSAGLLLDNMSAGGRELYAFFIIRMVALLFIIIDVAIFTRISEMPYESPEKRMALKAFIMLPLKHKPFLMMMLIMVFWNFTIALVGTYYTSYLLDTLGLSYRFISIVSSGATALLVLATPLWKRVVTNTSWLKALGLSLLTYSFFVGGYGFVFRENVWLYVVCVAGISITAPGINLAIMSLPFLHTPQENQTMFISLFSATNTIAMFLGVAVGNTLMVFTQNLSIEIFGLTFINKQLICVLQGIILFAVAFHVFRINKQVPERV